MNDGTALQKAARWMGLVGSVLIVVLGLIHLIDSEAKLKWPKDGGFFDDINMESFRMTLFSFSPTVFVDAWTPLVFGLLGIGAHVKDAGVILSMITADFVSYGMFNLVCSLFAGLAYNGGIGIIFGSWVLVVSALSFVLFWLDNGSASLELQIMRK